jgi:hypothetical protein
MRALSCKIHDIKGAGGTRLSPTHGPNNYKDTKP